ncbi:MAG TPA: DNA primase [Treponema sp.]|nr:DNA primase [Treponema sp.]
MAKITNETIEEVSSRTNIVAVVGEYTRLEQRGADWWGCCPFHNEKTPSFHIIPERNMYYCFGCGEGGGVIKFVMEIEKLTFVEAVESLAKKASVEIRYEGGGGAIPQRHDDTREKLIELYTRVAGTFHFFLTSSPQGEPVREYLAGREVSDEMVTTFNLGFAPGNRYWLHSFLLKKGYSREFLQESGLFSKNYPESSFFSNRLMFPISNRKGEVVAFSGRLVSGTGPKYLNTRDLPQYKKGETLFGFDHALPEIRSTKSVIFCEGCMDVLAWNQSGIQRAVAPLGTAFTEQQARMVRSFAETVYFSFDSDTAGQNSTYKAILLCRRLLFDVRVLNFEIGKDPADILKNDGPEALKKLLEYSILDFDYLIMIAGTNFDTTNPEGKARAVASLFPYLEALESDIQRESTIQRLSAAFGITEKSLLADFKARRQTNSVVVRQEKDQPEKKRSIKRTAELRAVLAVAANPQYFQVMRSRITSDDIEDADARNLYIVLEDCYRNETMSHESIFAACQDEQMRTVITETIVQGEFAENAQKVMEDGIVRIRKNGLEKKRIKLMARMNVAPGTSLEDVRSIDELMAEKKSIDEELAKLKDMNE